jgi:pyruvate/2-oxoglutarate dehydrogenase complex dihydrolipoamide acyltransferase (E2) component
VADATMKMPDLSAISSTVKVVRWLVGVGEPVRRGQDLLEVETDKSTTVVESTLGGTLKTTHAEPGQEVPSGATIATFEVADAAAQEWSSPTPGATLTTGPTAPGNPPNRPSKPLDRPGGSFFARNRREVRSGSVDEPSRGGEE